MFGLHLYDCISNNIQSGGVSDATFRKLQESTDDTIRQLKADALRNRVCRTVRSILTTTGASNCTALEIRRRGTHRGARECFGCAEAGFQPLSNFVKGKDRKRQLAISAHSKLHHPRLLLPSPHL